MPSLIATKYKADVVWLGVVHNRRQALAAAPVEELNLSFAGAGGEEHAGLTRASCSRVTTQYDRGTEIRNTRQLSVVSAQELAKIAINMGLQALDPAWLGVSIVLDGIPDLTLVPPSSRLLIVGGASLVVDMENRPCQLPAQVIEAAQPGFGRAFLRAASGLRGVTAWVEREGAIRLGDQVVLHVPDQDAWPQLGAARAAL